MLGVLTLLIKSMRYQGHGSAILLWGVRRNYGSVFFSFRVAVSDRLILRISGVVILC